jgi:hypothetical protein
MRLKAEMHLDLTPKLLAPIFYVKVVGYDYPIKLNQSQSMIQKKGLYGSHQST